MARWSHRFEGQSSGPPPADAGRFRDRVLAVLRDRFPAREFAPADDPQVVTSGGAEFGLHNLYADYTRNALGDAEFRDLVVERFARLLAELDERQGRGQLGWDDVRDRLRPQLMPAEFRRQAPLLTFPFSDDVLIGVVVDSPAGYQYVRTEEPPAWGQGAKEVYDVAVENLERASSGIAMSFVPPPRALIGIETKDGYDAARILVPGIRKLAAEKLGEPFLAGVPNRDFLILWSAFNPAEFQGFVRKKLAADFAEQSYSLTPKVLKVSRTEILPAE